MKRLFFDIEVSPNIGLFWQSGYKLNIGHDSIIKERAIICICYKWEGQKTVHSLKWDEKQNDKQILKQFIKIIDSADEVVGHNGDNFDIKWIRTRCIFHNIDMMPTYKTIDTLKEARKGFKFNSNKLDYIGDFLGHGRKTNTSYDLWKNILLKKDNKALTEMIKYCKRDVELLESVFASMNKYIKPKSHIGDYFCECPECGSDNIRQHDRRISAAGIVTMVKKCMGCGKYHNVPENKHYKSVEQMKKFKKK